MIRDDSSTLSLLHTLFLLLLHQLHLRSSGIRSWRLGTPVLRDPGEQGLVHWMESTFTNTHVPFTYVLVS